LALLQSLGYGLACGALQICQMRVGREILKRRSGGNINLAILSRMIKARFSWFVSTVAPNVFYFGFTSCQCSGSIFSHEAQPVNCMISDRLRGTFLSNRDEVDTGNKAAITHQNGYDMYRLLPTGLYFFYSFI
jgi:hypothetical protein